MILWLTTFALSLVSALVPFLPIEAYILGAGAISPGTTKAIALGAAAGAGATVGKIVWYEAARRGIESDWAQRKLAKPKVRPAGNAAAKKSKPRNKHPNRAGAPKRDGAPGGGRGRGGNRRRRSGARRPG